MTTGDDVLQLEQGLKRLGFDPGPVDGTFDKQTSAAVLAWYTKSKWEPFGPTTEQLSHLRTLDLELADATKNKMSASSAAAAAARAVEFARAKSGQGAKLAAAELKVKVAEQKRPAPAAKDSSSLALEAARAKADYAARLAAAELATKKADQRRLLPTSDNSVPLALEAARAKAEYANRAANAEIAAKIADRALLVLDPLSNRTSRDAADAHLEVARAAAFNIQLDGELSVQAARREIETAPAQIELSEAALKSARLEGELAVQLAQREAEMATAQAELAAAQAEVGAAQVEVAEATVKSARLEGDMSIQTALDAQKLAELEARLAETKFNRIAADLELARHKVGVQLPVDEIVFLPALPVRVEEVSLPVGEAISGPVMKVTNNVLSVDSSLPLDAAPLVKPGMTVTIDESSLGIKTTGVVERVDASPGLHGVDGYHIYYEVRVNKTPTPLEGFSLRLTIPIQSTKGAVTTVPLSAVSLAADGTSRIQLDNNKGALEYVAVQPGLAADGFVEVTPVSGSLKPGQLVVVGFENAENKDLQ